MFVGGGVGGTVLYASYDTQFRENVEKTIPYSDKLFEMALGPAPYSAPMPKKPVSVSPPPARFIPGIELISPWLEV